MAKKKQETLVLFPDLMAGTRKMTDAQFGSLMRAVFAYRFDDQQPELDDPMVDMAFGFIQTQLDRYEEFCEVKRANGRKAKHNKKEETEETAHPESNEIMEEIVVAEEARDTKSNQSEPKESKTEQRAAHTHTHTHTHTQNHTHTHNHNHSHIHPPTPPKGGLGGEEASMIKKDNPLISDKFPPDLTDVLCLYATEKLQIDPVDFYYHYEKKGWTDRDGLPIRDWKALARSWSTRGVPPI